MPGGLACRVTSYFYFITNEEAAQTHSVFLASHDVHMCGAVPSMAGLMADYKVFKMPSKTLSAFINVKMLVSEDNISAKLVY